MNANQIAQIATFLNVSPNQIKRVEEWKNVLFVVATGLGARFVSKKVLKMELTIATAKSIVWGKYGKTAKAESGHTFKYDGGLPTAVYHVYDNNGNFHRVKAAEFLAGFDGTTPDMFDIFELA